MLENSDSGLVEIPDRLLRAAQYFLRKDGGA
jgi:hypothetical protein